MVFNFDDRYMSGFRNKISGFADYHNFNGILFFIDCYSLIFLGTGRPFHTEDLPRRRRSSGAHPGAGKLSLCEERNSKDI